MTAVMTRHVYPGNSDTWFELPDDITQGQLEDYENTARKIMVKVDDSLVTDSLLSNTTILSAIAGNFIGESDGIPLAKKDMKASSARVNWWMAEVLATFIQELKTPNPNS